MIVTITSSGIPIDVVVTCDSPNIVEVVPAGPILVTVSVMRDGEDGESAYQIWLDEGNVGTEADFLESLQGEDGKSAYQIWLDEGNVGTEQDFLDSLKGQDAVNNTLEMVRAQNNVIQGDIDANGNTIVNIRNAVAPQEPASLNQLGAGVDEAKAYADSLVTQIYRPAGECDASTGLFPTVGTGSGGSVRIGDTYNVTVAGVLGGILRDVGDSFYAKVNNPGQTASNWARFESNTEQSTESVRGTAKIATAAIAADENTLNDTDIVTGKKLWLNFWQRVLALSWTWTLKQIFTTAPRFSSVTASQYLKVDSNKDVTSVAAIPMADVTGLTAALTFDTTIIDGSTNPPTGNAVFDALATKADGFSSGKPLIIDEEFYFNSNFTVSLAAGGTTGADAVTSDTLGVFVIVSNGAVGSGAYALVGSTLPFRIYGGEKVTAWITEVGNQTGVLSRIMMANNFSNGTPNNMVAIEITSDGTNMIITGKTRTSFVTSATATSHTQPITTKARVEFQINNAVTLVTFRVYNAAGTIVWTDTLSTSIPGIGSTVGLGVNAFNTILNVAPMNILKIDRLRFEPTQILVR